MSGRDDILGGIVDAAKSEPPQAWVGGSIGGELCARLAAELASLGAEFVPVDRLDELCGQKVFADSDVPAELLTGMSPTNDVWAADVGVTWADYAVADTGSLLVVAGPGRHRLASLAPPHHVAIVRRDRVIDTAETLVGLLPKRTAVVITGPSRTADIEGVIVRGIHGPRKLWVLLVD